MEKGAVECKNKDNNCANCSLYLILRQCNLDTVIMDKYNKFGSLD
jgi:hypothetical protein